MVGTELFQQLSAGQEPAERVGVHQGLLPHSLRLPYGTEAAERGLGANVNQALFVCSNLTQSRVTDADPIFYFFKLIFIEKQ